MVQRRRFTGRWAWSLNGKPPVVEFLGTPCSGIFGLWGCSGIFGLAPAGRKRTFDQVAGIARQAQTFAELHAHPDQVEDDLVGLVKPIFQIARARILLFVGACQFGAVVLTVR